MPSHVATVTGASARRRDDEQPDRIGRFIIVERLGAGGMGVVFSAYDTELDRRVAIKLLHPERRSERGQARMFREAQAMARVSHPNVVPVYDAGIENDRVYLAMEFIAGKTLSQWLEEEVRPWQEALPLFIDAAQGLAAAHAAGLVHRDFKPDNVLLADSGRVCVADFGIASLGRLTGGQERPPGVTMPNDTPLTSTGAVVGTPRYMSPEQHAGMPVGPEADQFSFCVALHEALFGARPFGGSSLAQIATNVLADRYRSPTDPRGVPAWLLGVVRRGLRADPGDRFPDMNALIEALRADPGRRRNRRLASVGLSTLVVASVGAATASLADVDPCIQRAEDDRGAWHERLATFGEALMTTSGAASVDVVTASLDRYAERWTQARQEVCQDETMPPPLRDAAVACLERRSDSLEGFLDAAAKHTDADVAQAAARLPPIKACTSRSHLSLAVEPPSPGEQATAVASIRRRLDAVATQHGLGSIEAALPRLEALADEAEQSGYRPVVAEHALVSGRLAIDRMDFEVAEAELRRATLRGFASGMDVVVAEALARHVFVAAMATDRPLDALPIAARAEAALERIGDPADLRALLANNRGVAHALAEDYDGAARSFAEALALADDVRNFDAIDHSGFALNLAMHTEDADERDALFVRSEMLIAEAVGPQHIEALSVRLRRGQYMPDARGARELLGPVCRAFDERTRADPMRAHLCHLRVAELSDLLGDVSEALAAAKAAVASLPTHATGPGAPYERAQRMRAEAYAAVIAGDGERAVARLAEAEAILVPKRDVPWVAQDLADIALLRARTVPVPDAEIRQALANALELYQRRAAQSFDQAPRYRAKQAAALLGNRETG